MLRLAIGPKATCTECHRTTRFSLRDAMDRLEQGRLYRKNCISEKCTGQMLLSVKDSHAWGAREAKVRGAVSQAELNAIVRNGDTTALTAIISESSAAAPISPPLLQHRPRKVRTISDCTAWHVLRGQCCEKLPILTNGNYMSGAQDFNRFDAAPSESAIVLEFVSPIELVAVKVASGNAENGGSEAIQHFELHVAQGMISSSGTKHVRIGIDVESDWQWTKLCPSPRTYMSFGDALCTTQRPQLFSTAVSGSTDAWKRRQDSTGIPNVMAVKLVVLSTYGASRFALRQIGARGRLLDSTTVRTGRR